MHSVVAITLDLQVYILAWRTCSQDPLRSQLATILGSCAGQSNVQEASFKIHAAGAVPSGWQQASSL